jgi:UDP-N-acetylglucosamine 2-epimerase (non-hydrolysing)
VASKVTIAGAPRPQPLIAHVEAGLRSFDRSMPEEINRILTDALADFLFITERSAETNLLREGVSREKIYFVGNTMVDTLLRHKKRADDSEILRRLGVARNGAGPRPYGVVTLHRPSNVDDKETLRAILEGLAAVGRKLPVFFPVHPRTMSRLKEFDLEHYLDFKSRSSSENQPSAAFAPGLIALEPLSYFDFLCLMSNARLVLTDSGGIQEETTVLGVPCVTLRENTERPVTITHGTNVLAGASRDAIVRYSLEKLEKSETRKRPELWDGHAGDRIIEILSARLNERG